MTNQALTFKPITVDESYDGFLNASIIPIGNITAESLTQLLKDIVERGMLSRSGLPATCFNIRAYPNVDAHDQMLGGWIGWYFHPPAQAESTLTIRYLDSLYLPAEERFGLTEAQRKEVCVALWKAEGDARGEANAKYPVFDIGRPAFAEAKVLHRNAETHFLVEKYAALANQYHVTIGELHQIGDEGFQKNWPGVRYN